MPVAVAHIPGTARRARAGSVGQKRVEAWGGHIVHRDDREALRLFVHDRSSQDCFVRALFVSIRPSSLVRPFSSVIDPVCPSRGNGLAHCVQHTRNSHALTFRLCNIVDLPEVREKSVSSLRWTITRLLVMSANFAGLEISARLR
jgi:hypothetical protein